MSTFENSKIRTAKKRWTCAECVAAINVGQEYLEYEIGPTRALRICHQCVAKSPKLWDCRAVREAYAE